MATLRIRYTSKECLPSCSAGEVELQSGELVTLTLKEKNPLWPAFIKAYLVQPAFTENGERVYNFDFDDEQLNAGPTPDSCDFGTPTCWSCCDVNAERMENLISALIAGEFITENDDGTFDLFEAAPVIT